MNLKELNPESSPQAAFGARLRSAREARGWTQEELAERTDYSSQHVSAAETGRKPPTLRFSRGLDVAFGFEGTTESFERAWGELRNGVLLEGFPEFVGYESRAVEIRLYEIGIVPGLLQTPEYARVLVDAAVQRGSITPELAEERISFLTERQTALIRPRPPMVIVVMDESCIHRQVGGPAIMGAQLDRLVQFAEAPNSMVQIAPYAIGERRPFNYPLTVLTLQDRSVVAYAESQTQGHFDRHAPSVLPQLTAYHQLQAVSASQAESVAMINEVRKGIP
ncbi:MULTISPECIES: helix-turn-helix domain-containing protein [Streptomyces]|uniref:Transcriptional regulator n=1 Tax=Streptomyces tsukubensis (strain DSM 42081 / NBRC 108919 / NRRL 18488 / 9993) TaxID=1114943 RepID=A0A7G3UGH9_STRT9|nr:MULTISPECIES: helix-turn-helix transcriptional regulator [Streptomyces]AZK94464.1 transcriptional regulator [Streptomyces tsukubensis]MYS68155.1 helix-turn-helix domain-containing protein [Streptomyces sp. SID5473]QKM69446.1 transcriptional regulator [Streptomyces tsukubensis NRRL18488]TAI42624.1 transcriptional regulator [Streptomyces tsukubensis]